MLLPAKNNACVFALFESTSQLISLSRETNHFVFVLSSCIVLFCFYFCLQARDEFSALLSSTEDWLYDEGEDEKKQVKIV